MNNFVFNSASLSVYTSDVDNTCDCIFTSLSKFIDKNNNPSFFVEKEIADIELTTDYSLQDYCEKLISRNRELADFAVVYLDMAIVIDSSFKDNMIETSILVGDDTRFIHDCSIKYAFVEDEILVSVSEDPLWKRDRIECTLIGEVPGFKKRLYNLHSLDISYLPHNLPAFSLYNNPDFTKTGRYYRNQPIFKKESANQYWYYDFYHRETNPHYEVFNRFGHHIGEGDPSGFLVESKADNTKHIEV